MSNFDTLCEALESEIERSYTEGGVTLEEAEKLAGQFLHAQIKVSTELRKSDLDSRMRKSGLKAVRASVYIDAATKGEKKPTEAAIEATITTHEIVQSEQDSLDKAEVRRDELQRLFGVFKEAHVHFRQMSKGRFE